MGPIWEKVLGNISQSGGIKSQQTYMNVVTIFLRWTSMINLLQYKFLIPNSIIKSYENLISLLHKLQAKLETIYYLKHLDKI